MKRYYILGLLCLQFLSVALFPSTSIAEKVKVVVSIRPQLYFVQQLGGELVDVTSMLPEGAFPGIYEPTSRQMQELSKADMFVRIKVAYENAWWEKMLAANPDMYVVDSTAGVDFIEAEPHHHHHEGEEHQHESEEQPHEGEEHQHEGEEHSHENEEHQHEGEKHSHENEEHQHEHRGQDPHIWLSPRQVKIQVENIFQGLVAVDPEHKDMYAAKKEAFLGKLELLDEEIQAKLANLKTRKFMIFHPAWSYFARDYDLEQIAVEVAGKEPSAKEMTEFIKLAQEHQIGVIFVQPQTSRRSVDAIAKQIGATVEILNPLAADWFENMQNVSGVLAEHLSE